MLLHTVQCVLHVLLALLFSLTPARGRVGGLGAPRAAAGPPGRAVRANRGGGGRARRAICAIRRV